MEGSSQSKVAVTVLKIPMFLSKRVRIQLPDPVYGQWLIFENELPKYYFDSFDEMYSPCRLEQVGSIESYLIRSFKEKNLNLYPNSKVEGIHNEPKATFEEIFLDKLPVEFLC